MSEGASLASRLRVVASLGHDPNLRALGLSFVGYKLTELASWIVILTFAYGRGGVIESGVVAAAMLLPSAVIVPIASSLGDRGSRVGLLAGSYALMAFACAACAVALVLELHVVLVYLSMLVLCVAVNFSGPLQMASLVALARSAQELTAANVVNGLIESGSYFFGPLVAALLLPWTGPWAVFAVLAGTMATSTLFVLGMDREEAASAEEGDPESRSPPEPVPRPTATSLWRDFGATLRWTARNRDASLMLGLVAGHEVLVGAVEVLFVAIAFDLLGTGDSGAALLNAAFGLGLVGGALVSLNLIGRPRIGGWLVAGGLLTGLPLAALAGVSVQLAAMGLFALTGLGALLSEVAARTLFQRVIPPYRVTQTFGVLESIGLFALTLGMLVIAAGVDRFGVAAALVLLGLGLAVVLLVLAWPIQRLESRYGPPPADVLDAVAALPIFRPLGVLALEQLARSARPVEAAPGETLIRQGDPAGEIYVLLEGKVDVHVDDVRVRTQGPGGYFGEIAALHEVPRTATVIARSPIRAIRIAPALFVQAVSSHPRSLAIARNVARDRAATKQPRAETLEADDTRPTGS